jgi:hypothetical protein
MISKEELIKALPLAGQYTETKIPKRRGGFRTLLIPSPELKRIQRKILRFLKEIFPVEYENIYGLLSGSYIEHAKCHSDSCWIFSFDLKDAFPSVDISKLRKIIYERIRFISFIEEKSPLHLLTEPEIWELSNLLIQLTTFNQTLPQGAPTSPFLFYLAITQSGLLEKVEKLLPQKWKISCYIDGFVISGPKPLNLETKEKIFKTIEEFGFRINQKKIYQFDCRQGAPLICGIRVDGKGRISLPKKKIKKWRGIIHRAILETDPFTIEYLTGKVEGFISSIRPIYGENLPPQIEKPYQLFQSKLNPQKSGSFYKKARRGGLISFCFLKFSKPRISIETFKLRNLTASLNPFRKSVNFCLESNE